MRLLWLSTSAGLWPSHELEHRAADGLARDGVDVTVLRCDGVLDRYCPVMQAQGLSPGDPRRARHRACRECRFNRELTRQSAAYETSFLDRFADAATRQRSRDIAGAATPATWQDIEIDGIPVGRYATYLTMLNHKVAHPAATPESWAEYLADLETAALALMALPAAFEAFQPTHGVVYNPLYPVNRMFAELCGRRGVQLAAISAGGFSPDRCGTLVVFPSLTASQTAVDSPTIRESLEMPLTEHEIRAVSRHLGALTGGNDPWVYSSPPSPLTSAEIRSRLGAREGAPLVVALIGSPDETRASMLVGAEYERIPHGELSDVEEFVRSCIEAARAAPGTDVVLRLHPRLAANKRDRRQSPDLARLLALMEDLPANVVINEPADGLSLYDLLRIARGAVNQSSSAGLEFLAYGLRVLQYDAPRNNAYRVRHEDSVARHDTAALAAHLARAGTWRVSIDRAVEAYRWLGVTLVRASTHVASWETDPGVAGAVILPAASSRSGMSAIAARLAPRRLRRRLAEAMARRERRGRVAGTEPLVANVVEELRARFAGLSRRSVWDPLVRRRGEAAPEEAELVREEVVRLLGGLGVRKPDEASPVSDWLS